MAAAKLGAPAIIAFLSCPVGRRCQAPEPGTAVP